MPAPPVGLVAADLPADAVEVGHIADAFGVKGWFRVYPYSADPQALFASRQWFLMPASRGATAQGNVVQGTICTIRTIRYHAGSVIAQACGVDDRNAAAALRGARIWIARSSFPAVQQDEYYWVDLIGLNVINRQGHLLGVVCDLLSSGPQTVLVIESTSGPVSDAPVPATRRRTSHTPPSPPCLIPFVSAYVDDVDLAGRRILVDWQAGD